MGNLYIFFGTESGTQNIHFCATCNNLCILLFASFKNFYVFAEIQTQDFQFGKEPASSKLNHPAKDTLLHSGMFCLVLVGVTNEYRSGCARHSGSPVSYMQCCQWMFCILKYVLTALMGGNTPWIQCSLTFIWSIFGYNAYFLQCPAPKWIYFPIFEHFFGAP